MKHNVLAPSVGESITEVSILKWVKKNGQAVKSGDLLLEIESDKATVEIVAEFSGALTVLKPEGERVPIGDIIGMIDDAAQGTAGAEAPKAAAGPAPAAAAKPAAAPTQTSSSPQMGPAARKVLAESGLDSKQIQGTGKDGRITKGDVLGFNGQAAPAPQTAPSSAPRAATTPATPAALREGDRRVPMSNLRARIAERLVQAQHTAAILTTFNEADMGPIMELRAKHKDAFKNKHGVPLSFMSFFTRASTEALKMIPEVNASIDGRDIIYHDYCDIGIAVGSDRGLVVPVVRSAEKMGFVEIEKKISELALKARDGKLSIAEMSGGTFTISNGGTYGSLLSTPILNPPQSGILGMHKIQERPMAVQGKVEIRPMMYLALSYDHRIIDGKGAVTFLVTLKDYLEHPEKLGLEF
ncbi:MAG: 2-oxoglutarate dehydrogenase complex dihydrolipoyllysine-residue succinyltransferase [Bdellovibrio sp.]|nr:2-oxoglutarate dehydrogenase complex dihydrolipoyllysine-residue succinyltransferase [Bdellovibrio sp.]